jgi:transposase
MRKIRVVLEYRLGKRLSADQTSQALSTSKGSVINIGHRFKASKLPWPLPTDLSDEALETALYPEPENPGGTGGQPDVAYIEKELSRPHVTLQRLYEEYSEQHPDGLKRTAFYDRVTKSRPPKVTMKVIHKGGDLVYSDYSGDGLEYIDRSTGEVKPVDLFVCCWGASSFSYADGTESQKTPDFSMSHVGGFEYFGVLPFGVVLDNLKSGVHKSDRYDPIANPLFAKMLEHYGVAVLPARVRKPRDKAVVESAVLHIQRFILARLRDRQFFSLDEVNAAIREELEVFNNRPMKEYGGQTRRQRFEELDRPFARQLPQERFAISQMKLDVRVARNYHVRFADHHYSVPWHLAGKLVDVYRLGSTIEIYHGNVHVCRHQAGSSHFGYSTSKDHMPPNHAFVKGWSKEWFMAQAGEIGPATVEAVCTIMSAREHVQQGFNSALGVLRMAKAFTPRRLERACQRAVYFKAVNYRSIKAILDQHLDEQLLLMLNRPDEPPPVVHENIRGPNYYTAQ